MRSLSTLCARYAFMAVVLCAVLAGTRNASAAIVLVTNATSGWTVTRTTSSAPEGSENYLTMPYDGTPTTTNAVVTAPNALWTATSDPRLSTAKWISADPNSGVTTSDPFSTRYVFQTSFTLNQVSLLNMTFAGDNLVDNIVLSTAPNGGGTVFGTFTNTVTPIGDQSSSVGRINGFTLANVLTSSMIASGTVFVTATLYNYGGPPVQGHFPDGSSYGFIMSVDASPAPLPGSLWGGMGLITLLALGWKVRHCLSLVEWH